MVRGVSDHIVLNSHIDLVMKVPVNLRLKGPPDKASDLLAMNPFVN